MNETKVRCGTPTRSRISRLRCWMGWYERQDPRLRSLPRGAPWICRPRAGAFRSAVVAAVLAGAVGDSVMARTLELCAGVGMLEVAA